MFRKPLSHTSIVLLDPLSTYLYPHSHSKALNHNPITHSHSKALNHNPISSAELPELASLGTLDNHKGQSVEDQSITKCHYNYRYIQKAHFIIMSGGGSITSHMFFSIKAPYSSSMDFSILDFVELHLY